ncbi:titin homolog isoform X2 [Brachypodium distachyon]|uniref:titin homolog isoform X2 n=1 Tax=Brachypodium distachyon TaxID=15368 RepID=UPI000D0DDAF6|nr:titin homolog isoform X2 [Brachypodium distachyon]|eukprot:XP_024311290.1 titin homolog isoform X2 [Brachypodium distachyon]
MDARIVSSRADAARKMLLEMRSLVMEKDQECQKLKGWHPGTSRKRKYASSLSDDDDQNGNDEEAMGNLVQEPLKKKGPQKRELQQEDRRGKVTDNKSVESDRATQEPSQAQVAAAEAERLKRELESTHDLQRRLEAAKARSQKAEEDKATAEASLKKPQDAAEVLQASIDKAIREANAAKEGSAKLEAELQKVTEHATENQAVADRANQHAATLKAATCAAYAALWLDVCVADNDEAVLPRLQAAPARIAELKTEAAKLGAQLAFVVTKCLCPTLEWGSFAEGLAAETTQEEVDVLRSKTEELAAWISKYVVL